MRPGRRAIENAAVHTRCLLDAPAPAVALRRYKTLRLPRTSRLQYVSHARAHLNHLPVGPEQRARDTTLARADPLTANGWICGYDLDAG